MNIHAGSRRAPPKLMARARQRGPVEGSGSQAGNILHLRARTPPPPELDNLPYAGVPLLNAYRPIHIVLYMEALRETGKQKVRQTERERETGLNLLRNDASSVQKMISTLGLPTVFSLRQNQPCRHVGHGQASSKKT